jgi:hypothetical protein
MPSDKQLMADFLRNLHPKIKSSAAEDVVTEEFLLLKIH